MMDTTFQNASYHSGVEDDSVEISLSANKWGDVDIAMISSPHNSVELPRDPDSLRDMAQRLATFADAIEAGL